MSTLAYSKPSIFISEEIKSFTPKYASAAAGHVGAANVIVSGDIVTLAAGFVNRAATNAAAAIYGYASFGEFDTFQGSAPGTNTDQLMFGIGQVGTLLPANPGQIAVIDLARPMYLDINVTQTTGWLNGGAQQVNIGSTGGLLLDPATNLYVFDPTQANKVMTIFQKPAGPFQGQNGDLGARVRVYFNAAALA